MTRVQKIVDKSRHWWRHGKHAAIPPHLRPETSAKPDLTEWHPNVHEAMESTRRKHGGSKCGR